MAGHRPFSELVGRLTPERRAQVDAAVAEGRGKIELARRGREIGLSERHVTELIWPEYDDADDLEALSTDVGDVKLGDLRRFVEAAGGRLRVQVDLPDGRMLDLGDLSSPEGKAA